MFSVSGGAPPGGRVVSTSLEGADTTKANLDARRMRKAMTRRTIDHCASILQYLEDSAIGDRPLRTRLYSSLQPAIPSIINVRLSQIFSKNISLNLHVYEIL